MKQYILKSLPADGKAYGGFRWPLTPGAVVTAPDWDAKPICGGGLHGALNGVGDGKLFCWDEEAVWIVAEIIGADLVDLGGIVKIRQCRICVAGTRADATEWLRAMGHCSGVIGGTATAGYGGTATAGYGGTATAGDRGTATAGDGGTATVGDGGTATVGDYGTATVGDYGGTATAGDYGTATAGYRGTATAGDGGTATAGDGGTATAGDGGTATAGYDGTAAAGYGGTISIWWYGSLRRRLAVGYVGENGILPNVPYLCDRDGTLVRG